MLEGNETAKDILEKCISQHRWNDDGTLDVWIDYWMLPDFMEFFKYMADCTDRVLHWVWESVCIEDFEHWCDDLEEEDFNKLFPKDEIKIEKEIPQGDEHI